MNQLLDLFLTFARIGGLTFGGGYAMLPILQREVVVNDHDHVGSIKLHIAVCLIRICVCSDINRERLLLTIYSELRLECNAGICCQVSISKFLI